MATAGNKQGRLQCRGRSSAPLPLGYPTPSRPTSLIIGCGAQTARRQESGESGTLKGRQPLFPLLQGILPQHRRRHDFFHPHVCRRMSGRPCAHHVRGAAGAMASLRGEQRLHCFRGVLRRHVRWPVRVHRWQLRLCCTPAETLSDHGDGQLQPRHRKGCVRLVLHCYEQREPGEPHRCLQVELHDVPRWRPLHAVAARSWGAPGTTVGQ